MYKRKWLVAVLLCLSLSTSVFTGCKKENQTGQETAVSVAESVAEESSSEEVAVEESLAEESVPEEAGAEQQENKSLLPFAAFYESDIPEYTGELAYEIHGNVPYFTQEELGARESYEYYSPLDSLGRCGTAYGLMGQDLMPSEDREPIDSVHPSGWNQASYPEIIEDALLFNRCHLIAFSLAGENANELNLITGTDHFNKQSMTIYEGQVRDYIYQTNKHVLYRVTPVFVGDELVARGVLMEGYSTEDKGQGVCFNVFCPNVQPGVIIDYATGDNQMDPDFDPALLITRSGLEDSDNAEGNGSGSSANEANAINGNNGNNANNINSGNSANNSNNLNNGNNATGSNGLNKWGEPLYVKSSEDVTYVLNTNSMKFHKPSCDSVQDMKAKNREETTASRDQVISQGYDPCGNCKP